jgi:hypothetical protein
MSCTTGACGSNGAGNGSTSPTGNGGSLRPSGPRRIPIGRGSVLTAPVSPAAIPGYQAFKQAPVIGLGPRRYPAQVDKGRHSTASGHDASGDRSGLGDPITPRTTRPLHLIRHQAAVWEERNPQDVRIGDWTPLQSTGEPRLIAKGVPGGMSLPYRPTYTRKDVKALVFDRLAVERMKVFKLADRYAHVAALRSVRLTRGASALAYAQAPRINPTTPSLVRGVIREWLPPLQLRGERNEKQKAPRAIYASMIRSAERNPR